jgi:hypothetical protein
MQTVDEFINAFDNILQGDMGHTAALFNPDRYVELLEQALV